MATKLEDMDNPWNLCIRAKPWFVACGFFIGPSLKAILKPSYKIKTTFISLSDVKHLIKNQKTLIDDWINIFFVKNSEVRSLISLTNHGRKPRGQMKQHTVTTLTPQ